ncbi:MAG: recombinase family protein [Planctomycetes bacterium]|nr:recombinase family protein [Planctomycetota bacterium]
MTAKPRLSLRTRAVPATKRAAIYTRKSTSKGLDQEFTSLDAQRSSCEAYITSQAGEGWMSLPERYDDGGFSGASIDRPAFQRLLTDVMAGKIDVIVCYKIDRLSRSLLDFAKVIQLLEENGVEFVSVTQQFSTANSMGRLTLNILMSFAEFEREVISERTRDKMAASRRQGLWVGGHPPLGYDCVEKRLVVVPEEADRVREIFTLYERLGSLGEVVNELDRRGWRNKDRVTKAGVERHGAAFTKSSLRHLLTSATLIGKMTYKDEVHDGQHEAIVDESLWKRVQAQLKVNRRAGGTAARNKHAMLLRDLLVCRGCGRTMGHTFSTKGSLRYHYYICQSHKLPGQGKCEGARAPARELETFVVARIRDVGKDPGVVGAAIAAAQAEVMRRKPELEAEARRARTEIRRLEDERRGLLDALATAGGGQGAIGQRIGELGDQIERLDAREQELRDDILGMERNVIDEEGVRAALAEFDRVWAQLVPKEQIKVLRLLVERIEFDGGKGEVEISYRPGGMRLLAEGGV